MSVKVEIATVYRSGSGRRFFTKKAAVRSDVFVRLLKKYDGNQEIVDHERGKDWFSDKQMDIFRKIADRYLRRFFRKIG